MKRFNWTKEPWKLILPKDAISPTNSVYRRFDIVIQSCCISSIANSHILHSAGPFTVRFQLPGGKIRELSARLTK